jgi:putative Mg2+ transporter-C (MgtC) family protein
MDTFWHELGVELPEVAQAGRVALRLIVAVVLGGLVGLERERVRRVAGLRTHMLVALGAALFTVVPMEASRQPSDLAEIVKGLSAGIGFLGAGTILKLTESHEIHGLTTAASIWFTAAAGVAVGAGWFWAAIVGVGLAWGILATVRRFEHKDDATIHD